MRDHAIHRGAHPRTTEVVVNGVDHERFTPSPLPRSDEPHVLFVGRLIANKGPDLLLRAAETLWHRGLRFRLTMVGDGPMLAAFRRAAERLRALDVVGSSNDVATWFRAADLVVRPSFTEGHPLTVLEAMASGRPVIVSSLRANLEVVRDGKEGLVHRVGDVDDLAHVLAMALADRALREDLARHALVRSRSFSWDATADGHGRMLVDAARRHGSQRAPRQRGAVEVVANTPSAGSAGPRQRSHTPGP